MQPARRVEVPRGHTLLMKGPASARCVSGRVEVFGYRPPANELIVARPWKTLPIYALEDSVLEVSAGPGSSTEVLDFDAIPQEWRELPLRFRSDFRVAVLGRVDSGKTSLLLLTMNERIGEGPIAVADLDVGQPEVCPPTTFALAEVSSPTYRLSSVKASAVYPFGFTTPSYATGRSLELIRRHLSHLAERGRVLINLDGWIDGPQAVEHKASIVRALRPTDVVAIETEVEGELLEACREVGAEVHHVARPPTVPRRDREERKRAREMGYSSALRDASLRQTVKSWLTYYHVLSDQPVADPERYLLEVVAAKVREHSLPRLVVDPVFSSHDGFPLLSEDGIEALRRLLLPLAMVVTPNLLEAETLVGHPLQDPSDVRAAAKEIWSLGPRVVIVKGGHGEGPSAVDLVYDGQAFLELASPRLQGVAAHGTGCTFATAIAAFLARGMEPLEAIRQAKEFVARALAHAFPVGRGRRPLHHFWAWWPAPREGRVDIPWAGV